MEGKKQEHTHIDLYILLAVLVILGALLYVFVSRKDSSPAGTTQQQTQDSTDTISGGTGSGDMQTNQAPVATATPQPKPIPKGKTDFFVSVGNNVKGPRMGKGTIDPYDPGVNAQQTVTIEVNDTVPVEKVVVLLKTDNKVSTEMPLEPVPGSKNWKGSWTVDDSYLYTYELTIKATSASGTSSVDVLLR